MTATAAVLTPRGGEGSSHFALAAAAEVAQEPRNVLLVDCDAAGGTIADILGLNLGPHHSQIGMAGLWQRDPITAEDLLGASVEVPGVPRLRLIPNTGLMSAALFRWLPRLVDGGSSGGGDVRRGRSRPVINNIPGIDVCIFDLGTCLAHPELDQQAYTAELVTALFQRVFVVMNHYPSLFAYNLSVLQGARLGKGELILGTPPGMGGAARDLREDTKKALRDGLPTITLGAEWSWDPAAALRAEQEKRPMSAPGLARKLGIVNPSAGSQVSSA